MGIRFFCPNGHSLNVKSELAGKIGFCPKCNVRMVIPMESTRAPGEHFYKDKRSLAKAYPADSSHDNISKRNLGNEEQYGEAPVGDIIRQVVDSGRPYRDDRKIDSSETLFNDPKLLWYARTQDGQEYGPATGDVFREWIKQRRIGPLMPVWRQDWECWQEAGKVFPEIKELFERSEAFESENSAFAERGSSEIDKTRHEDDRTNESLERLTRRQKKAINSFWIICGLIGVSLGLLLVLIFVLLH